MIDATIQLRLDQLKRGTVYKELSDAARDAQRLQDGDPDWTYEVEPVPATSEAQEAYLIKITDEDGEFVAYWSY